MKLSELKTLLAASRDHLVRMVLPEGNVIPPAYHLTEVGRVRKDFVDCGGVRRSHETCVLQVWVGQDAEHRLRAERFRTILELGRAVVPADEIDVEIEYEAEVISQYPIFGFQYEEGALVLRLGNKHTDCLARATCLPETQIEDACCSAHSCC